MRYFERFKGREMSQKMVDQRLIKYLMSAVDDKMVGGQGSVGGDLAAVRDTANKSWRPSKLE